MRVTNQMMFQAGMLQTAAARDKVLEAQNQVTTGRRVVHPGDDPAAAGGIVTHTMTIDRLTAINESVARASDESQLVDGALMNVNTLLTSAREIALQLGNDKYTAVERQNGAAEIQDLSRLIGHQMNTQAWGRFLFGGNVDSTPPFDASGNYLGDTAVRQVEVAPGFLQDSSIRADQVMKGVGGGVDVFAVMASLADALNNNDSAAIRASSDGLAASVDQVSLALSQNGRILNSFESAQTIGAAAKDSAIKLLASVSEVDIFEAISQLTQAQQSLEATLAVTAKSFGLSLLDFLPVT